MTTLRGAGLHGGTAPAPVADTRGLAQACWRATTAAIAERAQPDQAQATDDTDDDIVSGFDDFAGRWRPGNGRWTQHSRDDSDAAGW